MDHEIIKSFKQLDNHPDPEINKDILLISLLENIMESNKNPTLFNAFCDYLHSKNIIHHKKFYSDKYAETRHEYINKLKSLIDSNTQEITSTENNPISFYQSRYINDFVELEKINTGGFGSVHKATNKLDGMDYAIKKIPVKDIQLLNTIKVINEVKILAKLNHDNIIRYYSTWIESTNDKSVYEDVYDSSSDFSSNSNEIVAYPSDPDFMVIMYIQMELCQMDLKEFISQHILTKKEANTIMLNILNGIQYIHSKNIVHCDLTLKNILIDHNNNIKITDFGLARELNDQDHHIDPHAYGTQLYMAPELLNHGKISTKTDIYSLGIIYFELITNFKTDMERSRMILKLKRGELKDDNLMIISQMIQPDDKLRQSIEEIIKKIDL
ncbi:serine/threonine protein kinase [Klosneuvirus KNV1]|uniref:Eukaryotic translation initiation factor 2-alpha kinase 1 n=1 Tax=Klosneuvirus KNV1 TaxID=1977640 RepID=A0A1V0SKK4_9VIRU|nr:serine/threonine protein kinase [Klosneuvirus KNV1]